MNKRKAVLVGALRHPKAIDMTMPIMQHPDGRVDFRPRGLGDTEEESILPDGSVELLTPEDGFLFRAALDAGEAVIDGSMLDEDSDLAEQTVRDLVSDWTEFEYPADQFGFMQVMIDLQKLYEIWCFVARYRIANETEEAESVACFTGLDVN